MAYHISCHLSLEILKPVVLSKGWLCCKNNRCQYWFKSIYQHLLKWTHWTTFITIYREGREWKKVSHLNVCYKKSLHPQNGHLCNHHFLSLLCEYHLSRDQVSDTIQCLQPVFYVQLLAQNAKMIPVYCFLHSFFRKTANKLLLLDSLIKCWSIFFIIYRRAGHQWSIPYSLSQPREDIDRGTIERPGGTRAVVVFAKI